MIILVASVFIVLIFGQSIIDYFSPPSKAELERRRLAALALKKKADADAKAAKLAQRKQEEEEWKNSHCPNGSCCIFRKPKDLYFRVQGHMHKIIYQCTNPSCTNITYEEDCLCC